MKLRKLKRLRQEWAGRDEFLKHGLVSKRISKPACIMWCGWRYLKELYGTP